MSSCSLPEPVRQVHCEYRFDTPHEGGDYRIVAVAMADDRIAVATRSADSATATTEMSFQLDEAQFYAQRIIAGDMGAARRPGMSRLLAAALLVCLRLLFAHGVLTPVEPDDGEGAE